MSLTLQVANYAPNNILEKAKVAADAETGQPVFRLDNPQGIAANDYLLLGKIGGSQSKIYKVQSVVGDLVTLTANLEFYLERGTEVTKLFGNKIKIYTAPYTAGVIPTTADFTALVGGVADIDPDQLTTSITDPNGSELFWYRNTYFNETTLGETPLADSRAKRDVRASNYATIDDIRREAGFQNVSYITDDDIDKKRQAAQAEINGALSDRYVIPFPQPTDPFITDITTRLAAGLLMCQQFGSFDGNGKTLGAQKRDEARADLKKLKSGESVLTDAEGVDTTKPESRGFSSGFSSSNPRAFDLDDIQGYRTRNY